MDDRDSASLFVNELPPRCVSMNPYEPPATDCLPNRSVKPCSPPTRPALAAITRSFLDGQISSERFLDELEPFHDADDPVIEYVAGVMWLYYDDSEDELVCLDKPTWDYFQRLLLLLATDCRIESAERRDWSLRQLVAAVSLAVFGFLAWNIGWGYPLFFLTMSLGMISIALSYWPTTGRADESPFDSIISPFDTFADLAAAYRSASFRKMKYPRYLSKQLERSPVQEGLEHLFVYTFWLSLSPIPLFFQMLPAWQQNRVVVVPPAQ